VNWEETVKVRTLVSGAAFALLAATLVTSSLEAQERTRRTHPRHERQDLTTYNTVMGDLSGNSNRARMGVHVDVHQPSRYDDRGARLVGVTRNSPARDAGLEEGDIITSINGLSLMSRLSDELEDDFDRNESLPPQRLQALVGEMEPGDEIDVEFIRNGEKESVSFEAEAASEGFLVMPTAPNFSFGWTSEGEDHGAFQLQLREFAERSEELGLRARERAEGILREFQGRTVFTDGNTWRHDRVSGQCPSGSHSFVGDNAGCLVGAEIREIEAGLGSYFNVEEGLLVVDATEDNPLGLEAGDVILEIGGREIASFRRLRRLITSYEADETIQLTVMRDGGTVELEGILD